MIIEKFESFSKKLYEYTYPSESTIIPKLKDVFNFKEQKNYKFCEKIGCPNWGIIKNKSEFYNLISDYNLYFIFKDNEILAYYADPKNIEQFGYIVDCDNIKYNFEDNQSFLKLLQKFPTVNL